MVLNIWKVAEDLESTESSEDLGRFKNLKVVVDLKGLPHFQRLEHFKNPSECSNNLEDPIKANNTHAYFSISAKSRALIITYRSLHVKKKSKSLYDINLFNISEISSFFILLFLSFRTCNGIKRE